MPAKSFTVFRDAPTAKPPAPRPLGRSVSAAAVLTASHRSGNGVGSLPEKENMHPLTGLGSNAASSGKKRKASESSGVLATKVLAVSESSSAAKLKPKRADLKRKASSQAASGKTKVKKECSKKSVEGRKALSDIEPASPEGRETSSRLGLRSSSAAALETIKEEVATQVADERNPDSDTESLAQVVIDSRCYELTVTPLADVSDAYLQSSDAKKEEVRDENLPELRAVKEKDPNFALQIRDYFLSEDSHMGSQASIARLSGFATTLLGAADELDFTSAHGFVVFNNSEGCGADNVEPMTPKKPQRLARSMSLPCASSANIAKDKDDKFTSFDAVTLSTPERKELYATFTFATPRSSLARAL